MIQEQKFQGCEEYMKILSTQKTLSAVVQNLMKI